MTKHTFSSRLPLPAVSRFVRQRTGCTLLLAPLLLCVPMAQAQSLKPSLQLRAPEATARAAGASGGQQAADYIVAVVNSEPITNNEVRAKLVRAEQQLSQQGAVLPPRSELARQVMERLINDKAQLQLARSSGLRVEDNAVENAVLGVARQNQLSLEDLRRRLVADGISYVQFRSDLRDEILMTRLRQRELESRVTITEQNIDQFLREQQTAMASATPEINLAQILIAVPENATAQQVAALQTKAVQAAERARAGADFGVLANEMSDSPTRATGGQMGLRSAERYPPLFLEATKNLPVGGIADLVRSGAGFHVLKLVEKKQADTLGMTVTQTRVRHILLRTTPALSDTAAREKLLAIKQRIVGGQSDFAAQARQNSEDASAREGGDLGWASPGTFVPEFEQVMNTLAPGQISEPLTSRFGTHLIQVVERRDTELSKREQREMARNALREIKQEEAYALWAQEVRGRAYVEYREPPQ
ncbi:MAG: molecular chaperone SurA [Polaromonas sp.]|nr:MAG: molecular chaperone SurA [Polaromonas sp.]